MPWEWVDFEERVLHFTQSKTGRVVHVPMHPAVRKALLALWEHTPPSKRKGPIWPNEAEQYRAHGAGAFSNAFYDLMLTPCGLVLPRVNKQGVGKGRDGKRVTAPVSFHSFRHAFVSLLKVSGGNQAIAKELAGHSSDVVSDLYTHMPADALQQAVARLPEVEA